MTSQPGKIPKWAVLFLSEGGEIVDSFPSRGKTPERAFKNLNPFIREHYRTYRHRMEPFPRRLETQERFSIRFEVPGMEGERILPITVNEYHDGIGFSYSLIQETNRYLCQRAPLTSIKKLASMARRIASDLEIAPKRVVIHILDSGGIGQSGYLGRAIVGRDESVCVQMELFEFSLSKEDHRFWEGVLYHEFMHVKYVLQHRWPSMWPYYPSTDKSIPYWLLDPIVHFAIDGWLENHKKPFIYFPPVDKPEAGFKASRLSEFIGCVRGAELAVDDLALGAIADRLWGRQTDIWEVVEILSQLGLTLDDTTPLGQWLKKDRRKAS
jgi:hypothetical protein